MEESNKKQSLWNQPWVKHVAIVLFIFLLLAIGVEVLRNNAQKTGDNLTTSLSTDLHLDIADAAALTEAKQKQLGLLVELFDFIKTRREHNRGVYMLMYTYHFTSTTLLLLLSSVSTILLLIVAQKGIANTKPYFKTMFFTVAFITTFYAVVPQVYDFEENIETNFDLYRGYEQLRYEIYLYATLMMEGDEGTELQAFPDFYTGVIHEMRELVNIGIRFDSEAIATPDFNETQPGF